MGNDLADHNPRVDPPLPPPPATLRGTPNEPCSEIMDNCIYVTHQVFELFKKDENAGKLLATGFLFNFVILLLQTMEGSSSYDEPPRGPDDPETTH